MMISSSFRTGKHFIAGVAALAISAACQFSANAIPTAAPGESFATVAEDGAWCWFSEPRAVFKDGKTYTGWVTTDGSIQVGEIDASNHPARMVTLHEKLQRDDHDNPAFLFLPDGRLAAFYNTHGNDDLFLRITEKPGDFSAWTPERRLGMRDAAKGKMGITYANPVRLADEKDRVFVFFRGSDFKPNLSISDDLCQTWSKPQTLVRRQGNTDGNRPYVRYWDDGKGRIDILFTDGHPRNEMKNRVHFMRYEKGAFWKADGTKIGMLTDLPLDPEKADVVYDGSAGRGWIWDITEDKTGNPIIAYTRLPGDTKETIGRDHRYHYARWDGKAWVDHEIARGGKWFPHAPKNDGELARASKKFPHTPKTDVEPEPHYSPGLALDKTDPSVAYYSAPVKGVLEIFRAVTSDGGATWTAEPVTQNSFNDNVRPITIRNPGDGAPAVLWMNLRHYRHFTDYDVSIRMSRPAPAPVISAEITPLAVCDTMKAVADWQLDHPAKWRRDDWTQGAFYAGAMALAGIATDSKYEEAMLRMGVLNGWQPGPRVYHADEHCVGMAYCELYMKHKDPAMIKPLAARFDEILAKPSSSVLDFKVKGNQARWSWCDSLFMAPPAWLRLAVVTGDKKYLEFMNHEWWATTDFLYDKEEHLYFRDSTYFTKREANGKKVFWGRGNGWAFAGLARVLQYLPKDHPDRPRYETLFKEMAEKIRSLQQSDGLWRASLLDPDSYPLKETSGSGFYCFGLAWGVNNGLLDRTANEPAVRKAWAALVGCVQPDGKLTHVQPVGADPKKFNAEATEVYGVGAFLLAGSELYKLAGGGK